MYKKGGSMPATDTLADTGYTEAIKLMASNNLRSVELWRPEAFDKFRKAFVDGELSPEWLAQLNRDLMTTLGPDFTAILIDREEYPEEVRAETEPVVIIQVTSGSGTIEERSRRIILRPTADQVLTPIRRTRMFP